MSDLRDLYQELILDHGKRPRNKGVPERWDRRAEGVNPLCGDRIEIFVDLGPDGRVERVRFAGSGCAISTASASLLTESLVGLDAAGAEEVFQRFHDLVTGARASMDDERYEKLDAFQGVSEFPVRVKCATLPWHAFRAALERRADPVSTE